MSQEQPAVYHLIAYEFVGQKRADQVIDIVQDKAAEEMAKAMGQYDAKVVTMTLGSQLSGEVDSFAAVSLGEDASEEPAEAAAEKPAGAPADAKASSETPAKA